MSIRRSPLSTTVTVLALVFLYLPLTVVVLFSFHKTGSLTLPFTGFSLRWYRLVLGSGEFRTAAMNSLVVALTTATITFVLGTCAAYGLSRSRSRLRGPIALLLFLPLTLPGLFIGLSLLVFFGRIHVTPSLKTVVVAHCVYVFPFFVLIVRSMLERLDPALEDVAIDLGAGRWKTFTRVTLPQIWPVLIAASCLAFALSFDEFVITFFVIGPDGTLPLYIWSQLRRTVDPSINVVSTLLMAVTFLLWGIAFALAVRNQHSREGAAPTRIEATAP